MVMRLNKKLYASWNVIGQGQSQIVWNCVHPIVQFLSGALWDGNHLNVVYLNMHVKYEKNNKTYLIHVIDFICIIFVDGNIRRIELWVYSSRSEKNRIDGLGATLPPIVKKNCSLQR